MENQHRMIKGYRDLNQSEIELMNEIKSKGQELQELIDKVHRTNSELVCTTEAEASRWASIARTHPQQGIMALTRAVAKPEFF
ncbi:MAG: hypothetical protein AAF358_13470 [Pseudomonadota bacterium]